jgi:ribosomal protein L11 methyltransferase
MLIGGYIAIARANAKGKPARRMADSPTNVARLAIDEATAKTVASLIGETFDDAVCAAFEGDGGQWQVAIHFSAGVDQAAMRALVARAAGDAAAQALRFEQVGDADWVAQSLAGLKPVRAGRFMVHGAHDRARVPGNAIGIEIEAALAFGTGHHGTTRGCLVALDSLAKRRRVSRTLDIGTGSGVLAIAAARIFRKPVVAGDIDRVAVQAAQANARLNRAANFTTLLRAAGAKNRVITQHAPYDLIFANILLGPLMRLAVPLARLSRAGATIVLSGLLPGHANAALAIYRAQGLSLERFILLDGWVTLVLRKANRPGRGRPGRLRW